MKIQHERHHGQEHHPYQFPIECMHYIFSYLQLKDCLSFAATSTTSLREVLPTIRTRHDRTTKTSYGVIVTSRTNSPSSQASVTKYNVQIAAVDEIETSNNGIIFKFPSLTQRVTHLAIRMPHSHPSYTAVAHLNKVLVKINRQHLDNNDVNDNIITQAGNCSTTYLIKLLQQYILPLRLHAKILYNTVLSNHCYESNTTTLDNYIGDVLCVTYLLYDFDCPTYAEHSVNVQWLTSKLRLYSPTCYQSWVLIHASILRTKPFIPEWRIRIGFLSPPSVGTASSNSDTGCFQYIDSIYERLDVDGIVQTSKLLFGWWHAVGILQIRTDQFVKSEMCLIYDDFGPLGPNNTFRGRDIVRVRDITADTMTECLLMYQPSNDAILANTPLNVTILEAIEWICIVHEQSCKSRPMSVRVPMIRFN